MNEAKGTTQDNEIELPIKNIMRLDLRNAVRKLRGFEGYVHVVCHRDADGICAGAILSRALQRAGYFFRTTVVGRFNEDVVEELAEDVMGLYLLADIGSGYVELIEKLADKTGATVIVLDHHKVIRESRKFLQINCNNYGISGSFEVSGSVMALLFACVLDMANFDLIDLALAGAAGDKQNIRGFKGLTLELAELGFEHGEFTKYKGIDLGNNNIKDSLIHTFDPYFPGLSGREEAVDELLSELNIDPGSSLRDIQTKRNTALNSALVLRLLESGVDREVVENLISIRYTSERIHSDIGVVARIVNGCAKLGESSLALSYCLAPEKYREEAVRRSSKFNARIIRKMTELEEGLESLTHLDYFTGEEREHSGTVAGVVIRYLTDGGRPLLSATFKKDSIDISARGTKKLVDRGLDLAVLMSGGAEEVGGSGGGHPIAAGATVPEGTLEKFLEIVDERAGKQLPGE